MKIVFVSNYMNHHQLEISKEFIKQNIFVFVACEPITQERLDMGYRDMNKEYDFILRAYESNDKFILAKKTINDADVVIFGSGDFELVRQRIEDNKLTFKYSERLFKNHKLLRMFYPKYVKKIKSECTKYKDKNYYLLCASAYAERDYNWFGAFKNKCFKWGYFPNIERFDNTLNKVIEEKNSFNNILWCGRFIDWKHPEYVIDCAKYLKKKNISFKIKMVGTGPIEQKIKSLIIKSKLEDCIEVVGALPFDQVQAEMKKAKIFLFTSDQNEGWGAVLNESMGNACCVIADHRIGSVPFMIKDGENGFVYTNKKAFLEKVHNCLIKQDISKVQVNAYNTAHKIWNAENAVKNLIYLVNQILKNENSKNIVGPCEKI